MIKMLQNSFFNKPYSQNLICFKCFFKFSNFSTFASISISSSELKKWFATNPNVIGSIFVQKLDLFKLSNCKQHLLRLVNILGKEKIFLVPIYEPNQQCLKFNE